MTGIRVVLLCLVQCALSQDPVYSEGDFLCMIMYVRSF